MAKHIVKCLYCKESFDANKEEFVLINSRRYAHKHCYEDFLANQSQEDKDKQALEEYIKKLFNESSINVKIKKQIERFIKENQFTYSGIHRSLIYFYEIKHHSIDQANGGVGIVPHIYDEAKRYYYSLWLAQQKNENKDLIRYKPNIISIAIPLPKSQRKKRKLFTFLDEEENV